MRVETKVRHDLLYTCLYNNPQLTPGGLCNVLRRVSEGHTRVVMDRPRTDSGASIFVTHRPLTSIHWRRLGFRARRLGLRVRLPVGRPVRVSKGGSGGLRLAARAPPRIATGDAGIVPTPVSNRRGAKPLCGAVHSSNSVYLCVCACLGRPPLRGSPMKV